MNHLAQMRIALEKAEAKVKRLAAQVEAAQTERDELDTAIRVLERFSEQSSAPLTPASAQSDNGELIFGYVGIGRANARAPKEIIDAIRAGGHELGDDLIRTQLWRMAKRNELRKDDGRYWRPVISQSSDVMSENDKAPEPEASGAFNRLGPVGREGGYPPSTPEGSTPSGSTQVQRRPTFDDDLDDDVPF